VEIRHRELSKRFYDRVNFLISIEKRKGVRMPNNIPAKRHYWNGTVERVGEDKAFIEAADTWNTYMANERVAQIDFGTSVVAIASLFLAFTTKYPIFWLIASLVVVLCGLSWAAIRSARACEAFRKDHPDKARLVT
jgi:hypothetical protein